MKTIVLLFAAIFLISSCSKEDEYTFGDTISIHLVKDGQITPKQTEANLDSLKLEESPVLEHSEIEFYDWSSHLFYAKSNVKERIKNGRCYLIKADNDPLFLACMNIGSSLGARGPQLSKWTDYILGIGYFENYHEENTAVHKKFKATLRNSNLLKNGIELDIVKLKRKNATTLLYTFEVTNIDTENIYVLNPDKMEPENFHYFTNGVGFEKDGVGYPPNSKSKSPENGLPKDWFYKILPGEVMTCTVEQEGFSDIPTGEVSCGFTFPGYTPKDIHWKAEDGRYWLGRIHLIKSVSIE